MRWLVLAALVGCAEEAPPICADVQQHFDMCDLPAEIDCSATTEANFARVLAMSCDQLGALMGSTPESSGKADFVIARAPSNWIGYANTTTNSVNWLYTWTTHAGLFLDNLAEGYQWLGRVLSSSEMEALAVRARSETAGLTCANIVSSAGRLVHVAVEAKDSSAVCRNYAMDLKRLLGALNIAGNYEGATTFDGWTPIGHAWLEVTCDGHRVLADAYNEIYIEVK